mgnify:CR=1 FL=1
MIGLEPLYDDGENIIRMDTDISLFLDDGHRLTCFSSTSTC